MAFWLAAILALPAWSADPVAAGRALFNESGCRACHAVGGIGGDSGPDLTLVGFRRSRAWLETWLASPRGWKHDTLMPDFKLTPGSREALVAYLSSLDQWSGPRPKDGAALFVKAGCVACHGAGGRGGHPNNNVQGGVIPPLPALVATYTKDELLKRIRSGKTPDKADPAGPDPLVRMPAWGARLDDTEISAVADYLMALAPKDQKAEW